MLSQEKLAVEDDTSIYSKYKNDRQSEIFTSLNKQSIQELDNYTFTKSDDVVRCNNLSATYNDCPGKKLKDCNPNLYAECKHVAESINEAKAKRQAGEGYTQAMVEAICK